MSTDKGKQRVLQVEWYFMKRPIPGYEDTECGDTGFIEEFNGKVFIGVVDVAGHGSEAYKTAIACKRYLEGNYHNDLKEIIKGLHMHIKGSRGAVVGLCLLDKDTGDLKYSGMGNITVRILGSRSTRFISRPGIVGYVISTPKEEIFKLKEGNVLLLYSDGVSEHFESEDYPGLLKDDVRTIATQIINRFGKEHDDAACAVLKYK